MTHYKSNLRDLEFNLFEVFGAQQAFGKAPFDEIDVDTARDILVEVNRLAREDLAASYTEADRNPPKFDPATHTAPLPEAFKKSYAQFMVRVLATRPAHRARRHAGAAGPLVGHRRARARGQRPDLDVFERPLLRARAQA